MAKKKELMNGSFPIFTYIQIPYSFVEDNLGTSSQFVKEINDIFQNYINILKKLNNDDAVFINIYKTLMIFSDKNLNKRLCLSIDSIYTSLFSNLNISEVSHKWMTHDEFDVIIRKKIEEFRQTDSFVSLKEQYPYLYNKTFLRSLEIISIYNDNLKTLDISIDELKGLNRKQKRELKKRYSNNRNIIDLIDRFPLYEKLIKYTSDIHTFTEVYADFFEKIIDNITFIQSHLVNFTIDTNHMSEEEKQKFELLIAVSMLRSYIVEGSTDDKKILYIQDFINRNIDKYSKDFKVKIRNITKQSNQTLSVDDLNYRYFSFDEFIEMYNSSIKDKQYLKSVDLDIDYKNKSREEILVTINNLVDKIKDTYTIIPEKDIRIAVKDVIENSKNVDDEDLHNKANSLIRKIDFLCGDNGIKPICYIKGKDTFVNYYGYVYSNGYVAFDYLSTDIEKSYGKAIYVIKLDDLNKYSSLSLSELRKNHKDKIPRINHKGNWEDRLKRIITSFEDAADYIIPEELQQIDMASNISQLNELRDNLVIANEEIEKRIQERGTEIIDKEIKHNQNETATKVIQEDLQEEEEELLSSTKGKEDFASLYEHFKNKVSKTKRNAAVSLRTKLRTKDIHGYMHCDFCDSTSKSISMFESHHIIPISEGGIDNLYNTACLCPNCHTRIHKYLKLREKLDSGSRDDLPDATMGEFILPSEYTRLLATVKSRILRDTPSYLHNFEELFASNYPLLDVNLTDDELMLKIFPEGSKFMR